MKKEEDKDEQTKTRAYFHHTVDGRVPSHNEPWNDDSQVNTNTMVSHGLFFHETVDGRHPAMMSRPRHPSTNNGFTWFESAAGFRPSTV